MTTSSYQIVQDPDTERWMITDGNDQDPKIWHESHWIYSDQCPAHVSFASREQAERYAHVILGRLDEEWTNKDQQR